MFVHTRYFLLTASIFLSLPCAYASAQNTAAASSKSIAKSQKAMAKQFAKAQKQKAKQLKRAQKLKSKQLKREQKLRRKQAKALRKQRGKYAKHRYVLPAPQTRIVAPRPLPAFNPPQLALPQAINPAFSNINFTKLQMPNPLGAGNFDYSNLGFGASRARTELYSDGFLGHLPTSPAIHPYEPGLNLINALVLPKAPLIIKLPHLAQSFITPEVEGLIRLAGVSLANIDTFLSVQDMPWQGGPLLFRPHSWLSPDEPTRRPTLYSKSFSARVAVLPKNGGAPRIQNQPVNGFIDATGLLSIHNQMRRDHRNPARHILDTTLISSGNTLALPNTNVNVSETLYSIVIHGDRAALTKHVLLDQGDEQLFENALNPSNTLHQLRANLRRGAAFSRPDIVDDFDF